MRRVLQRTAHASVLDGSLGVCFGCGVRRGSARPSSERCSCTASLVPAGRVHHTMVNLSQGVRCQACVPASVDQGSTFLAGLARLGLGVISSALVCDDSNRAAVPLSWRSGFFASWTDLPRLPPLEES